MKRKIKEYVGKNKCPECGEWIDISSRNCKYCGTLIAKTSKEYHYQSKKRVVIEPEILVEEHKICRYCREPNNINAIVCSNCSQSLKDAQILDKNKDYVNEYMSMLEEKELQSKKLRLVYFIIIILLVTGFMVLTIIHILQMDNNVILNGLEARDLYISSIDFRQYVVSCIIGYILLFICIIDNFYPGALFFLQSRKFLMVQNGEPSDYYFFITKLESYLISLGVLIYFGYKYYSLYN